MNHTERTLGQIAIGVSQAVSNVDLFRVTTNVVAGHIQDSVIMQIRGAVWGENKTGKTVKYPADWKQAFKLRWFPEWALRRHPAKMAGETVDFHVLYPGFFPAVDGQEFRIRTIESTYGWGEDHEVD